MSQFIIALKKLAVLIVAPALVGQACHTAVRPAAYGSELAACESTADDWAEYVPCCIDVARRYGRDPSFCMPDGGSDL